MLELWVTWVVGSFVLTTVLLGFLNGFWRSVPHLLFVFTIVGSTINLLQLLRWLRNGDLEPKFKFFIIKQAIWLVSLCCVANLYFWSELNCWMLGDALEPGQDTSP